jgi:hypothetical protein
VAGLNAETADVVRRQKAVAFAAKQARSMGNSQVVMRKKDGTIQSERTHGDDPRRFKG